MTKNTDSIFFIDLELTWRENHSRRLINVNPTSAVKKSQYFSLLSKQFLAFRAV